jgi:collagen triple helix repeat protein
MVDYNINVEFQTYDITVEFEQGLKGEKGDKGDPGIVGPQGDPGPQGPQGIPGPTGATGPQGPQGVKGDTGATGPTGAQGIQGPKGNQGDPGPTGPTGSTGATGPTGLTGPQGPIGNTGAQGPKGDTGAQGPQGIQGPQGPAGVNTWGSLTGTLSNQTDLQTALNGKLSTTGGTVNGNITMVGDIIGTGYTVDVSSLREDGVRVNQTYLKLSGGTLTGTLTGTNINMTGGTSVINTSATVTIAQLKNNNGIMAFVGGASNNAFQSINSAGTGVRDLNIEGYSGGVIGTVNIKATNLQQNGVQVITDSLLQSGKVTITPVANTPTSANVTFSPAFAVAPIVTCAAVSAVPGTQVTGVAVSNITTTGCVIYVTRTNTNSTDVNWIALG